MGFPPVPFAPALYLQDYQLLFLLSIYDYYIQSLDLEFVRGYWTNIKTLVSGVELLFKPSTKLLGSYGYCFLGPGNGSARSSIMVYTLHRTAVLTTALLQLWNGVGYKDISSSPPTEHISLNTNGFLLEAIFLTASNASADPTLAANLTALGKKVLDGMWSLMVTQNQYYTGAS